MCLVSSLVSLPLLRKPRKLTIYKPSKLSFSLTSLYLYLYPYPRFLGLCTRYHFYQSPGPVAPRSWERTSTPLLNIFIHNCFCFSHSPFLAHQSSFRLRLTLICYFYIFISSLPIVFQQRQTASTLTSFSVLQPFHPSSRQANNESPQEPQTLFARAARFSLIPRIQAMSLAIVASNRLR
jgi:hypothetical protein